MADGTKGYLIDPSNNRNIQLPKAVGIKEKKAIAKLGMTSSLGALVISGFFKFSGAKTLHVYSGIGLLGFTLWHHFLNQPKRN